MYRINLHPEYAAKRARGRQRVMRTALLTVVIAIEGTLVVALFITGLLLGERASRLRTEVARLNAASLQAAQADPNLAVARELLAARQARLDWSPKLGALGQDMNPSLILTGLNARGAGRGGGARLELTGTLRGTQPDLQAVSRFMETLGADARVRDVLPDVQLGSMEGGAAGRFTVICQARKQEGS